jgi:hypothetical protein
MPASGAFVEAAAALDAHGRTRLACALESRAGRTTTRFAVRTEARGYVPARALPEPRRHAEVALRVAGRPRSGPWELEAELVERAPGEAARAMVAGLWQPAAVRGLRLEARHDALPRRTVASATWSGVAAGNAATAWTLGLEARLDGAGRLRQAARVAVAGRGPLGAGLRFEARLISGAGSALIFDADPTGGGWARASDGLLRTRFELRGPPKRIVPVLSWIETRDRRGGRREARIGVDWATGPDAGPPPQGDLP